jgi:hypothetical protein
MVAAIYNRFMPDTDLNKPRIREECSGLAIQTTGIPCIHTILSAERGPGLSAADFHPHWHLPTTIPAIIPSTIPAIIPSTIPAIIPSALPSALPSAISSAIPSAILVST